ncbi:MAG TPA: DUF503 domain-containing protein [Longimicrobiales bacterium]|nr:DUF503 domain-containing protein [Longimicrobiales bacterium]
MVIGVVSWELEVVGAQSLKEKRRVIKSLKDRLRNRFNVSVAETAHQDLWQRAEITAAVVAGDRAQADRLLEQVDRFVAASAEARIIDSYRSSY